jgi:hypothetical protein
VRIDVIQSGEWQVLPVRRRLWTVRLTQGCQSFKLEYQGLKREATWYAAMFSKALQKHDKEKHGNI